MKRKIFLISPHPDDIALSLGCTIIKNHELYDFYIWDVYTNKKYNKLLLNITQTIDQVKKEEFNVWQNFSINLIYDKYDDAQLRKNSNLGQILGSSIEERASIEYDEKLIHDVEIRYQNLITIIKPDYIGVPIAIGNHIDHIIMQEIALSNSKYNLFFYEDMPYSINLQWYKRGIEKLYNKLSLYEYNVDIAQLDLQNKLVLLAQYKSQLTQRDLRLIRNYYEERFNEQQIYEKIWLVNK